MQGNRRQIHFKKRKILKYNSVNTNFIKLPDKFFNIIQLIIKNYCVNSYINFYQKFMRIFNNFFYIFNGISCLFTRTKRLCTEVNSICASIYCRKSTLFIFCRSQQFNFLISNNHYKNYTIIKKILSKVVTIPYVFITIMLNSIIMHKGE